MSLEDIGLAAWLNLQVAHELKMYNKIEELESHIKSIHSGFLHKQISEKEVI